MVRRRHLALLAGAILVTVPGILVRLTGFELAPPVQAVVAGAGIFGAAFLLLWACDAAQADVSQALALAVVALVAVLPEYAVDMYFTWQAGQHPESDYANFAIANMTGANRLLIGVAWGVIVAIFWVKTRKAVQLDGDRRTELFFLGLATVYALVIPIKGSLAWYDGVVLLGIYAWYIVLAARRPCTECEIEGPAELLMGLLDPRAPAGHAAASSCSPRRRCWRTPSPSARVSSRPASSSASTSSCSCSGWRRSPRRRPSSSSRSCSPCASRRASRSAACSPPSSTSGRSWSA